MSEIINKKQSRYGIASCLIGVLNLSYAGFWVFVTLKDLHWYPEFLFGGPGGIFALVTIPILFLVVPAVGNGIGLILGMIELFQPNCKRIFSVLGLIMNSLIPITLFILLLRFI